jgi:hypothetical protein
LASNAAIALEGGRSPEARSLKVPQRSIVIAAKANEQAGRRIIITSGRVDTSGRRDGIDQSSRVIERFEGNAPQNDR